eukprot:CAMPEP_0171451766 /NCGR_PEP_ID=MMETSP0945-20130129/137_1 /TAXON_ID=109269 /ORGANISM="Vaucheria litorea, Strain CCMP2940" /LENGTH=306 /DNA_ID=CAMNT_0011976287 /DNA_START=13 /DNA_END=933 /DNA_ORIENTATION=+
MTATRDKTKKQSDLIMYAYSGNLDEVKRLVMEDGVDADMIDGFKGSTPLHWACRGGKLDVAQWLVEEAGADPDLKNQDGRTPVFFACDGCHQSVIEWLVGSCGINVNEKDNIDGQTPLHRVCSAGIVRGNGRAIPILEYLVNHGRANVMVTDNGGKLPEKVSELVPTSKWKGMNLGVQKILIAKREELNPKKPKTEDVSSSIDSSKRASLSESVDTLEPLPMQVQPSEAAQGEKLRRNSKVKSLTAAFENQAAVTVTGSADASAEEQAQNSSNVSEAEAPTEDLPAEDEPSSSIFSKIKFFSRNKN